MSDWIVIRTHPRRRELAKAHVERQGAEFYSPVARGRGRPEPLFGTYAFVLVEEAWRFPTGTLGVACVLMSGERPGLVPGKIIQKIRDREDRDGYVRLPLRARFLIGQRVRVSHGCFAGCEAVYAGSDSLERERVFLSIMGRLTPTSVGAGSLVTA